MPQPQFGPCTFPSFSFFLLFFLLLQSTFPCPVLLREATCMEQKWGFLKCCSQYGNKLAPPNRYSLCLLCLGEGCCVNTCPHYTMFLKQTRKNQAALVVSAFRAPIMAPMALLPSTKLAMIALISAIILILTSKVHSQDFMAATNSTAKCLGSIPSEIMPGAQKNRPKEKSQKNHPNPTHQDSDHDSDLAAPSGSVSSTVTIALSRQSPQLTY